MLFVWYDNNNIYMYILMFGMIFLILLLVE